MEVFGSLDSKDSGSGKLKKGTSFPNDNSVKDGDLFSLVSDEGSETLYIRSSGTWTRLVMDGDTIDAGSY